MVSLAWCLSESHWSLVRGRWSCQVIGISTPDLACHKGSKLSDIDLFKERDLFEYELVWVRWVTEFVRSYYNFDTVKTDAVVHAIGSSLTETLKRVTRLVNRVDVDYLDQMMLHNEDRTDVLWGVQLNSQFLVLCHRCWRSPEGF